MPRSDGRLYPLHGVYDTTAVRRASDRTLATGSRRLLDLLARLNAVDVVDAPELDAEDYRRSRDPVPTTPTSVVVS